MGSGDAGIVGVEKNEWVIVAKRRIISAIFPIDPPAKGLKVSVEKSDASRRCRRGLKPCMRSLIRLLPKECKVGLEHHSSKRT